MSHNVALVTECNPVLDIIAKIRAVHPSFDVVSVKPISCVTFDAFPIVAVFNRLHPHLCSISIPLWVL